MVLFNLALSAVLCALYNVRELVLLSQRFHSIKRNVLFSHLFSNCIFFFCFTFLKKNKFIYLYVFIFDCVGSSSLCAAFSSCGERGYSSLRCTGFSLQWLLLLRSSGSQARGLQQLWLAGSRAQPQQLWRTGSVVVACRLQSAGSVVVAHGPSCSTACGIFPGQGSNPCPLHWQADS